MRRKIVFIPGLSVLLASLFCVGFNAVEVKASEGIDTAKIYGVEMLWNNSMSVNDVVVSKDGNYIAAVNGSGLYYFASNSSNPKWWYLSPTATLMSVAISADGERVVVGGSNGYISYFNDSRASWRTGEQQHEPGNPAWGSMDLGGPVERSILDMSGDGEYVVVGGTGEYIYYYANCTARGGGYGQSTTWSNSIAWNFSAVRISPDGKYVAVGGPAEVGGGFVAFYKGANTAPYPTQPDWYAVGSISSISDLAVSNDGYAVVAVDDYEALYYWANATTLSGMLWPDATWTNPGIFWRVDMSDDGSDVVTASSVRFWANARERQGNQTEYWVKLESVGVWDVAISEDGGIIAAPTGVGTYFFKSDGSIIGKFDLPQCCLFVSMSGDGRIVAMGGYTNHSLYVFRTIADSTSPVIENVYQQPAIDTVTTDDEVMVYANVTDDESGVKQVILNYTNGNGTWITSNMTNLEGNVWNGTILAFEYCTRINYTIVAEDRVGNIITTEEVFGYQYQYHVVPEFPSFIILPLFMIATLLVVIVYRRKHSM